MNRKASHQVQLSCSCGSVTGQASGVSPQSGYRLICMCRDCQAFARYLGRSDDLLDEHGGTDIYQLTPSQIHITAGLEQIRSVRLSAKGMLRFYSRCCKTPIANTMSSPTMPFSGVPHLFMNHAVDGKSSTEALGPVRCRINAKSCSGPAPKGAQSTVSASVLIGIMTRMLGNFVLGRQSPHPFFENGVPICAPSVLTPEQRAAL